MVRNRGGVQTVLQLLNLDPLPQGMAMDDPVFHGFDPFFSVVKIQGPFGPGEAADFGRVPAAAGLFEPGAQEFGLPGNV